MGNQQAAVPGKGIGLIAEMASIARNSVALLLTRIELAALELSEVRNHVLSLALIFAVSVIAVWFAVMGWVALLVVLAWDALGCKILLILAVIFSATAIGLLLYAKSMLQQNKFSLPATMSELQADRDTLF